MSIPEVFVGELLAILTTQRKCNKVERTKNTVQIINWVIDDETIIIYLRRIAFTAHMWADDHNYNCWTKYNKSLRIFRWIMCIKSYKLLIYMIAVLATTCNKIEWSINKRKDNEILTYSDRFSSIHGIHIGFVNFLWRPEWKAADVHANVQKLCCILYTVE